MYPSDYTYTYANGVDILCYSNAFSCYEPRNPLDLNGYPTRNWEYNINLDIEKEWLLTPFSTYVTTVMQLSHGSSLINYAFSQQSYDVRPVVYLKFSIQITGGDGSEFNPYTLSGN